MTDSRFHTINDSTGAYALVAPSLGGWLLRYGRDLPGHGLVEALHYSQEVVDRYPREMYAGSPMLFPMVSYNHVPGHEHHYFWNGQLWPLPQHGFARRLPWSVVEQKTDSITMELRDNEATRAQYPFAFSHRLTYSLADGILNIAQQVENRSTVSMPFSTGLHPYFSVPFTPRGHRSACFVEIPRASRILMGEHAEGFVSELMPEQRWSVDRDVSGTLFLGEIARRELRLVDPESAIEVVFNFEGSPRHRFAAIWSKSTSEPFYCLEPWTALPNSFTRTAAAEWILLAPGEVFKAKFWIELRRLA